MPGLIENVPIFRIKLAMTTDILDVKAGNPNTQVRTIDRHIEATIEDVHEVLVVAY